MGSPHRNRSQVALHEAFPGFSDLVADQIRSALTLLTEVIEDRPIRILDIGAGSVPYERAFILSGARMDLTFFDRDEVIQEIGPRLERAGLHSAHMQRDFFDLYDAGTGNHKAGECLGEFDLLVLSASVHELYFDAVAVHAHPEEFHEKLLRFLGFNLSPLGMLLISDYAWPKSAPVQHTWRIRDLQERKRGHADPPWAFVEPAQLQSIASRAGFIQRISASRGLYDSLNDDELNGQGGEFGGELTSEEFSTARSRIGYALTFLKKTTNSTTSIDSISILLQKASAYINITAEESLRTFGESPSALSEHLNSAFLGPIASLGHKSALWHLTSAIRETARLHLQEYQVPSPGIYEIWFGVGLEKLGGRFVLKLPCFWQGNQPREAGILSLDKDAIPINMTGADLIAGPVSDAYHNTLSRHGKNVPTVHKWVQALQVALRKRIKESGRNAGDKASDFSEFRVFRSVTLIMAQERSKSAASLALADLWGNSLEQAKSGHYVTILREPESEESMAFHFDLFLQDISRSILGPECKLSLVDVISTDASVQGQLVDDRGKADLATYGKFLSNALALNICDSRRSDAAATTFNGMWNNLKGTEIRYNVFSTIAVGCDGLSSTPPDTIMMFGQQAFPPRLLSKINSLTFEFFGRLGEVEAAVGREKEVQATERLAQQRQSLVSFGHDGKRPALTILGVVDGDWGPSDKVAVTRFLASSLWFRLGSYSSLLGSTEIPAQAHARLMRDAQSANSWAPISAIWRRELLCVILRCAVDESGWAKIRRALWSENGQLSEKETWERLRGAFAPILHLQNAKTALIDDELAEAMEETLRSLRLQRIVADFEGPDLLIPQACSGGGGRQTEARLAMALAFIFGEVATNTFRHQFPELPLRLSKEGLRLRLRVNDDGDTYSLELEFQPVNDKLSEPITDYKHDADKTFIGLNSIQTTIAAMGCSIDGAVLRWTSNGVEISQELPYFRFVKNFMGRPMASLWTIRRLIREGVKCHNSAGE